METFIIKALQLICSLSILVLIHELGHFIFAKLFKIRVEKFYLFFDPWFSLFKFKPKNSDTEYGIGWLPLGGYVKISGMIDESLDTEQMKSEPKSWEFRSKPAWQRLLVMAGGVCFNFILALVIYSAIAFHWGSTYLDMSKLENGIIFSETVKEAGFQDGDIIKSVDGKPFLFVGGGIQAVNQILQFLEAKEVIVKRNNELLTIKIPENFKNIIKDKKGDPVFSLPPLSSEIFSVEKGSLAEKAGLRPKDIIISINNKNINSFDSMFYEVQKYADQTIPISYVRANDTCDVLVSFNHRPVLGIANPLNAALVQQKYSIVESIPRGFKIAVETLGGYVTQMKFLFDKDGLSNLGGFGALGSLFPSQWNWKAFWELTAFLSIAIGFFNILPIPALDGGHIMFLLYEVITRRKPSDKFMQNAQMAGMLLLLLLIIIANGNDVIRSFF